MQGHVDAIGVDRGAAPGRRVPLADGRAFRRRSRRYIVPQGIDRGRRHQPDRRRPGRRPLRRADHPVHAGAHEPARRCSVGDRVNLECDMVGKYVARAAELAADAGDASQEKYDARNAMQDRQGRAQAARPFAPIDDAVDAIRAGRMIIVVDDEDRENEGDLTIAAEKVTPEAINFMARYGRGLICLSMTPRAARRARDSADGERQHLAVRDRLLRADRRQVSRDDRASRRPTAPRPCWRRSIPSTQAVGPGAARATCSRCARATGGVLVRAGQTEAAVDLARIAGLYPAGVICEIMNEDGTMARVPELTQVREAARAADDHDRRSDQLPDAHRVAGARGSRRAALPTEYGDFRVHAFESQLDKRDARRAGQAATSATARTCSSASTRSA